MRPGQAPTLALPQYRTDLVTRRMCATAHLDADFAREVLEEYAEDQINAVGLPLGINLVALVRHATAADRRRHRHDRVLAVLQAYLLVLVFIGVIAWANRQLATGAIAIGAGLLAFPAAAGLSFRTEWAARRRALELDNSSAPAQSLAPPVEARLEAELESFKRTNMVPYHASVEAANPFVGSGWRITEAVWTPIDISRPANPSGTPLTPRPFSAADLHHYLAVQMPQAAGLSGLKARNRLYIRGLSVSSLGQEVLPDPARKPLAAIPSKFVKLGASQSGAGMETYLCLRVLGNAGRVVVSMHLKAQLHRPMLSWEVAAYVLPPLGQRFLLPDSFSCTDSRLRLRTAREIAFCTPRDLLGTFGRLSRRHSKAARHARDMVKLRKEIAKGYGYYDYGSINSLRERSSHWGEMGYAERRDAEKYFKLMVQGVLSATATFLESHNIDTSDLRRQQQQIISTQTYHFNGVINGQVQAGNNGQMYINQGQGHPGQPPGGGTQPIAPPGGGAGAGNPPPATIPNHP